MLLVTLPYSTIVLPGRISWTFYFETLYVQIHVKLFESVLFLTDIFNLVNEGSVVQLALHSDQLNIICSQSMSSMMISMVTSGSPSDSVNHYELS